MIVKAYKGKGKFCIWDGVIKFDKFADGEPNETDYEVEEYVFNEPPATSKDTGPGLKRFMMGFYRHNGEEEYRHSVLINTLWPVYVMNDEGKTIDSFN